MSDDIESLIARSSELSKKAETYSGSPDESKSSGMFSGMGAMGGGMMTPGFLTAPQKLEPAPEQALESGVEEPAFDDFSKEIRDKQKKALDVVSRYETPPAQGTEKTEFPTIDAAKNWALESIEKGAEAISFGSDKPTPDALTSQLHQLSPSNITPEIKAEAAAVMDPVQLKQWPAWLSKTNAQHRAEFDQKHIETSMSEKGKEAWNVGVGIGKGLLDVGTRFGSGVAKAGATFLKGPGTEGSIADPKEWQRWGTGIAKLATVPVVSVAESLESVVQTASNAFQNGLSATDWVNEQLPVEQGGITREEAFQNYLGRKRADEYYAGWRATDPNVFTRVIMEDPKTRELAENMAYSLTSIWSPSVDDRIQRHNGDRDAAMREKQLDDLRDSQQLVSNFRQEAAQMVPDPDMTEAAGWTRFGMNPFDVYGRIGGAGIRGISKGIKAASRVGKTAEQIAAMEAEAAAKAFEAELKAAEAAKTPGWVEGLAGKVADKVEPAAAWMSARYSDLPESVQEGLAKMGSGMVGTPLTKTAAILASAGVAAPRIAQAALAGRRLAAGGVEGGFEAGAKAATEAAAKTGLSPRAQQWLANKSIPAAKTLDWMAQNSMEMARGSVHGATLAAAVGVLENKDIEEIADMMGQGIFLHLGGEVMGNMTGVSHGRYMGNLKRQRASAAKWFNELDPATQAHVRDLGNWDSYVKSLKGLRDSAENKYAQRKNEADNVVYSGESPENIQAAQEKANNALIELNIRNAQVRNAEKANSDTQKMYRDNLNIGMADVMTALNGSSKAGRNVEMKFTTAEELAREALTNNRDRGLTDLEMIELYNFVLGQSAEFAFIAENGGKHTLTSGKVVDLYTPYKDRININIDSIKARMGSGESALNAFGHEAGHAFWNIKEFREGAAETYKELFGNQKFDERGNLIGGDPGLFSVEDLLNKFKDYYARGYDIELDPSQLASMTPEQQKAEAVKRLAQKIGLWDPVMQELDPNKTAAYMRHEMMAELIQGGAQGGIKLGADPKPWLAPLVDWATTKQKNTKTGKKVRSAFGLTESAPWDSDLTGTRFSSEQVESTRNALRAVAELNGDIAAAEIIPHAPITETQLRSNEAVANQFGEAFFAHEKVATVLDKDGNVIESRVVTDPNAMEGTFEHGVTETGDPELRQTAGYGPIPAETHAMPVPEGGRVTITSRIKRDASGGLASLTPDQAKALNKARANIIRKAILDAPDREYPGRMDAVSADGLSLGGRLSPKQIEAIKGLPETIIPFGLKRRILEFNDLLARDDGDAMIGLYGQAMDRQGRYKSFAPKIVDFVPLGMRLSKDGNILFNMFSKTGMREKLRRWQRDTPELLSLWNGDGESFMGDVRKVLENWKPREGAPAGLPGETGLDADLNMAISKKNRVNDFLNIFRKTEPESLTANPARTTMRRPARRLTKAEKLDEESSDPNTLIRSYRVDRFHDLEKSSDAPFRVNYGKALYNLMPAKSEVEQRSELPPAFEESILKGLRSINAFYMGSGAPAARLPLDTAETFVTRFKPRQNEEDAMVSHGFYSKAGAVLLDKMPNRASAAQLKGILDPQKGSGVKPEELKVSGINQFIDATQAEKGFISKDDIRKWLKEDYAAQFETKVLRSSRRMSEDFEFYSDNEEWGSVSAKFKTIEEAVNAAQEMFGMDRREAEVFVWDTNEAHSAYTPNETEYDNPNYQLPGGKNYKETILQMPGLGFKSPKHFQSTPDYVAHLRTAEHGNGLLIDELQSDLHQLGREKGYKEPVPLEETLRALDESLAAAKEERSQIFNDRKAATKTLRGLTKTAQELNWIEQASVNWANEKIANYPKEIDRINTGIEATEKEIEDYKSGKKVKTRGEAPDAPFRKDWPLQLFKYALKDAVTTGKEWVGWTGGEKHAERYDLSEHVDSVNYDPYNQRLIASKDGQRISDKSNVTKEELADYIGKDLSSKLLQPETLNGAGNHVLSGVGLRVGGEGMKGFYDIMLPKEIGKYVKQWGAKVEPSVLEGAYKDYSIKGNPHISETMTFLSKESAEAILRSNGQGNGGEIVGNGEVPKIWKIAITPEMRESVAGGQTRFMPSSAELPVSKFEDEYRRVPSQEELDAMKAKLPKYSATVDVSGNRNNLYLIKLFDESNNQIGFAHASRSLKDPTSGLEVETTHIMDDYRGKGYGQAMYREIAKLAQGLGLSKLTSSTTSRLAANARSKILETNWRGAGWNAESNVPSDIRFSPAKLDSEYTAAFESKDEEKARGLVDQAAKQAGYNYKVYRGVENDYIKGDGYVFGKADQTYFTGNRALAETYANFMGQNPEGVVYDTYLRLENPFIPEDINDAANFEYNAKRLREKGYDGVIGSHGGVEGARNGQVDVAVAFAPSQIKSADPFTYDNAGRLIPLSERFNTSTGDIRFMPAKKGALEGIQPELKEEERRFFFTTSTERDAAIAELIADGSEKDIERLNRNSILHAMTGIKDIDISIENSRGVYKGDQEVSAITTVKAKRGADMDAVRSRFMDLAKVFKQMEVLEEKVGAGKEEMLGQVDNEGFKHVHSAVVEIGKMKPEMIEEARKKAGIDGLTMADGRVELLNRGDDNEFIERYNAFTQAIHDLGGNVGSIGKGISAIKAYSENPKEYPGTVGYDEPSLHLQTERGSGGVEYGRLNTPLARKLAQLGAFAAPAEGKRNFFEAKDVTKDQAKFQAEVAKVFDSLPDNDMQSGLTQEAYAALAKEIKEQYVILTSGPDGLKFTSKLYSEGGEPYKNSDAAIRDIRENNRLDFLKTDADAFGPPGADFSGHPLLKDSGLKDSNGVPLLYNDLFRAVHDTIAHGMFGSSFGPVGEEGAYHVHVRTIQNPLARWAMMTETRGQNSWVNYRPEMLKKNGMPLQKGDAGYIPLQDRGFAVQKAALLPLEYALTGDKEVDKPIMDLMKALGTYSRGSRPPTKQELAIEARVKKGVIAEQKEASEFVKGAKGIISDSIFVDGNNKVKTSVEDVPPYYLMSLGVRPLPNIEMVKEKGQKGGTPKDLLKLAQNPEKYDAFAKRLIASADTLSADPGRFASPKGYSEFMRDNGITGTVLSPPSMLKMLIETPQQYLDLLTGGFHEEKTVKGGWEAANGGLNGVMEMRALCGPEGPPPMVTALHHLWGTLSKQLPPLDQEACWLRLISDKRVLGAIQSSIDGTFDPLTGNWREIVASRLAETNNNSTQKFGNNAKSNANSFLLMLSRHNGRWNEVSDLYKTDDPAVMRTQFWGLNHGPSGIKNKVQGFIGLTFGVKAAVLDRWRWVELHLPMAMKLAGKSRPKDYFEYTGVNKDTPEDPTGIYKNYGTAESSHPAYSTTLYTGLERATNAAINNYAPLRDYLGAHADAGGLHWHVWNAIKNESVGHSSLDLTKSYLQKYGRNMTPDSFHQHLMNSSAYVEGENKGQIVRLIMTNGEFKVERQ